MSWGTKQAKKATNENMAMIDSNTDPVTYNLQVAIQGLADALEEIESRLSDLEKRR